MGKGTEERGEGEGLGTQVKPVLRYPGSKWNIADWIVRHMPDHIHYLEPYFGSGAVLLCKPRSKIETVNDIDENVVNLFRVMRNRPQELAHIIYMTPWSRAEYYDSYEMTGDELEDARRFLVRCWQSYGARLSCRSGWKNEGCGSQGRVGIYVWCDLPGRVLDIAERLRGVQIECASAVEVINRIAAPHVLIYADPPYLGIDPLYATKTSEDEHREMIAALNASPGPVLLSGYENELYAAELADWTEYRVRARADGGREREEILWLNPIAQEGQEGRLF